MPLDRQWIESRIPHRGNMCLLDEVVEWSAERVRCRTRTHLAAGNPLRVGGRLGIACGIEYAAQAMAVHGALSHEAAAISAAAATSGVASMAGAPGMAEAPTGGTTPVPAAGFLAGVRSVRFHVERLDDVQGDLICEAVRVAGDSGSALYEFELRGADRTLLSGRATVMLDASGQLMTR
jgi:predicted hotdog family 3-hydroxylacyl-ACP dehydratase